MAVFFAGVPLPAATPQLVAMCQAAIAPEDQFEFAANFGTPTNVYPRNPWTAPITLGRLTWPTGAQRWSVGHFLAGDRELSQILDAIAPESCSRSNPLPVPGHLTLQAINGTSLSIPMWLLQPRPIAQIEGRRQLYLLTLVDDRYFWWQRTAAFGAPSTWEDLYDEIANALDIGIFVDPIPPAYGKPPDFIADFAPLPPLLDQLAASVGQRIVVAYDGTVFAQNGGDAALEEDFDLSLVGGNVLRKSPAGGGVYSLRGGSCKGANLLLPSSVKIVFNPPDRPELDVQIVSGTNPYQWVEAHLVDNTMQADGPRSGAGLFEMNGNSISPGKFVQMHPATARPVTRVIDIATAAAALPALALVIGNGEEMTIYSSGDEREIGPGPLNALALQIAVDWYSLQLGDAQLVIDDFVEWSPSALVDAVVFEFMPGRQLTQVARPNWNDWQIDLQHQHGNLWLFRECCAGSGSLGSIPGSRGSLSGSGSRPGSGSSGSQPESGSPSGSPSGSGSGSPSGSGSGSAGSGSAGSAGSAGSGGSGGGSGSLPPQTCVDNGTQCCLGCQIPSYIRLQLQTTGVQPGCACWASGNATVVLFWQGTEYVGSFDADGCGTELDTVHISCDNGIWVLSTSQDIVPALLTSCGPEGFSLSFTGSFEISCGGSNGNAVVFGTVEETIQCPCSSGSGSGSRSGSGSAGSGSGSGGGSGPSGGCSGDLTFFADDTWIAPCDTLVTVECGGAGNNGVGGGVGEAAGSGGGGGAYASDVVSVLAGQSFTVLVGVHSGSHDSSFVGVFVTVRAKGGSGTSGGDAALCVGSIKFSGGNGVGPSGTNGGGAGGAAGPGASGNNGAGTTGGAAVGGGGAGGDGGIAGTSAGTNGGAPGGGGGGKPVGLLFGAGLGADGYVHITW